jgi:hypothetical protein
VIREPIREPIREAIREPIQEPIPEPEDVDWVRLQETNEDRGFRYFMYVNGGMTPAESEEYCRNAGFIIPTEVDVVRILNRTKRHYSRYAGGTDDEAYVRNHLQKDISYLRKHDRAFFNSMITEYNLSSEGLRTMQLSPYRRGRYLKYLQQAMEEADREIYEIYQRTHRISRTPFLLLLRLLLDMEKRFARFTQREMSRDEQDKYIHFVFPNEEEYLKNNYVSQHRESWMAEPSEEYESEDEEYSSS